MASSEGTDAHIQQNIHQKDLDFCLPLYFYAKVIVELEKTQTRNSTVLYMVLIIRPSSTLKSQFVFGFNECSILVISSLLRFENFWCYINLGCGCMTDYMKQMTLSHLLPISIKKTEIAKTTKCRERSVKRKSNLNFIRVIKNSSFDQQFLYIWSKPF